MQDGQRVVPGSSEAVFVPGAGSPAVWLGGQNTRPDQAPKAFAEHIVGDAQFLLHAVETVVAQEHLFFWLVVGTVVTVRLMTAGALPPAAKTGVSAYLAAPATASVAWMVSHPGPMGALQLGLTGVLTVMVLMQLFLIGEYRKIPFSSVFWVFTFPVATTGVLVPRLSDTVMALVFEELERAASDRGYFAMVTTSGGDPEDERRAAETLLDRNVDGLLSGHKANVRTVRRHSRWDLTKSGHVR